MGSFIATPAALLFTQQELGGPCREIDTTINVGSGVPTTQLAKGNGDRVGIFIMNIGSTDIYVGLGPTVDITKGIYLAAGGGFFSANVRDDFTFPTREFWAIGAFGNSIAQVLEIVRFSQIQEVR